MERKVNKSSIMATASVDDMQQEEKKRKWQDPNEDVKYVCDGGKVQCKYCSSPVAPIRVTTESVMLQDKPWATVGDNNGQVNFGFTGLCTHPSGEITNHLASLSSSLVSGRTFLRQSLATTMLFWLSRRFHV
ncbi:PAAR-like protein [Prevotella fusca]|uniref:PAAR-like protein n=1 Tax=Prevotella fusca TaxID=589436 RepID=UPI0005B50CAD|nr:PAAR-like protein [Prevotella fusca]